MGAALQTRMTLAEFLAWEAEQEFKHEFDGFDIVAMSGGISEHADIQRNIALSVGGRLRGMRCQFKGNDLKIEVAGSIRYTDGFVVCTPVPRGATVVRDPVVIFEVLSPSTVHIDHGDKNAEYAATPSVQRYFMLEQDAVAATVWSRVGPDWVGQIVGLGAMLAMPEIGIEVPLDEFYIDVALPERAA